VTSRIGLLGNADVELAFVTVTTTSPLYRNAIGDELIYVQVGAAVLESVFGRLPVRAGDYVVVPRGIVHRFVLGQGPHRYLVFESPGYVRAPKRYRGDHGQLIEGAPYSERDFRVPENLQARDEKTLVDIPENMLQSGSSELKNWIGAAGALFQTRLSGSVIDYQPCYRSNAGTGTANGFVAWEE
jgi:homogentisate 1,2-dioxygenase